MSLQKLIISLKKEQKTLSDKINELNTHKIKLLFMPKRLNQLIALKSALAYNREILKKLGVN